MYIYIYIYRKKYQTKFYPHPLPPKPVVRVQEVENLDASK